MKRINSFILSIIIAGILHSNFAFATITIETSNDFPFDFLDTTYGAIDEGYVYEDEWEYITIQAYNGCYLLDINGTVYDAGGTSGTKILNNRGIEMATVNINGLEVTRQAYVPTEGDYARYYDTIYNPGEEDVIINVKYKCDLSAYSSYSDINVLESSSGNDVLDLEDSWFTSGYEYYDYFETGHVLWHPDGVVVPQSIYGLSSGGDFNIVYSPVTVPAGGEVAFIIFTVQTEPDEAGDLVRDLMTPDETALNGISLSEQKNVVNWGLAGAPIIQVPSTNFEVSEGGTSEISIDVVDREGDEVEVTWDLDNDNIFDEAEGETATFDAAGIDGPSNYIVNVKASDGENERVKSINISIKNAPPVITSTPETTNLIINTKWTYQVEAVDPGGDAVNVSIDDRPQGIIIKGDNSLIWTPTQNDVGDYQLVIKAVDKDDDPQVSGDGDTLQVIKLTVSDNQPPAAPIVVSPRRNTTISDLRPTIIVTNTTDPEGDALTYKFDVDTSDLFSGINTISSGNVTEDPSGQTSWQVNQDLTAGQIYYIRVRAHDGRNFGPAAISVFQTEESNTEQDGGVDTEGDSSQEEDGGENLTGGAVSCNISSQPVNNSGLLIIIGFMAMVYTFFRVKEF